MADWRGKVNGQVMFGVSGPSEMCRSEMGRYAYQYLDEGDVILEERVGRKWVERASYEANR